MATINYKDEVLKVYPDAYVNNNWTYGKCCIMVGLYYFPVAYTESDAWENAYNNIKNQNK